MREFSQSVVRAVLLGTVALTLGRPIAGEELVKKPPDALERYLSRFAKGYASCGTISIDGAHRGSVQKCVLESLVAKKPFIARFDHQGYETMVSDALVMSLSGDLAVLHFDHWGCKEVECLQVEPCGSPKVAVVGKSLRVSCKNEYEF